MWYADERKEKSFSAASNTVGGWLLHPGGELLAPPKREGGDGMVTYAEFFTFCLVIIGIINLFLQIKKK